MASAGARAALVARLENELQARPGWYRLKLALLAALGYGLLGGALVAALAMSVGLVALVVVTKSVWLIKLIKVAWIPLVLAWLILRALWVRIEPPQGERVTRAEAPALLDEIERLRKATGAPPLAGVVIDDDLNAGAVAVPRLLGLLGHRQWLVLGLPLMQALDRAQFASVVAHEFGHMGGGHGRFSGWIYRVRSTWYRLLAAIEAKNPGGHDWLRRFFDWYAPYFDAYSFALARSNEYEADAMAARVAGKDAAASALLRVNLAARRLHEDFWPGLGRDVRRLPQAPATLYADLAHVLREPAANEEERLRDVLAGVASVSDTHPVVAQRLAAWGVEPTLPPAPSRSAAADLLGAFEAELADRFSRRWHDANAESWASNHARVAEREARLAELEAGGEAVLEGEALAEHALLVGELRSEDEAIPLLRRACEQRPDDAAVHFHLGRLLADRGDAGAEPLLRRAMALWPGASDEVYQFLALLHSRRSDGDALAALEEEHEREAKNARRANLERQRLGRKDVLLPHGLAPDALQGLARTLREVGKIARVWVARKQIEPAHGPAHYIVVGKWKTFAAVGDSRLQMLVDALDLPGTAMAIAVGTDRRYERRVKKMAGPPVRAAA